MPETEADPGPKAPLRSAERRRPGCAGRPTPRKRGVAPYQRDQFKATRLPALRPPLGWGRYEEFGPDARKTNPGAETRRGKEETALFDIVRCEYGAPAFVI
jgi:hypothetical protein